MIIWYFAIIIMVIMVYATSLRWFSSHDEDELDKISNHHLRFCLLGFIPHTMVTMTMMIHASIINNDDGDTLSRHCIGGSSRRPMGGRAGWQAYNPWWLWCSMMVEDEDCGDRNNGWWWLLTRMVDGDKDWRWWCCWLLFQPGHGKGWPGKAKLKTASKLFQYPVFFFYFFLKVFVLAPDDVFFSGEFSHWCCQFAKDTFSQFNRKMFSIDDDICRWSNQSCTVGNVCNLCIFWKSESHPTQFNASNISEVMTSCVGM